MAGAYIGTEEVVTCYLGILEMDTAFLGIQEACVTTPSNTAGWYQVTYTSDIYGDYDESTLVRYPDTGSWKLQAHQLDTSNGVFTSSGPQNTNVFQTNAQDNILYADRDYARTPILDYSHRCILEFNDCNRAWRRADSIHDYYLHPVNQGASNSYSIGVVTSDPRFLCTVYDPFSSNANKSGVYDQFPKTAYVWLNDGETLADLPEYTIRLVDAPDGSKWGITCVAYDTDDEAAMRQGIKDEFGPDAVPLDWTDLQDYYDNYGHLNILNTIPPGEDNYYGGVTYNGNYVQSGSRKYYVDEEGKLSNPGFSQFGIIGVGEGPNGGNLLDLGSWYGHKQHYVRIPALISINK